MSIEVCLVWRLAWVCIVTGLAWVLCIVTPGHIGRACARRNHSEGDGRPGLSVSSGDSLAKGMPDAAKGSARGGGQAAYFWNHADIEDPSSASSV